mmetsp:Transcript_25627/g.51394  ORF Transcript_25627/g.51394 Transcript_25627/m.51394 type:complete len:228 (+) Transcript_25627:59-742(+)
MASLSSPMLLRAPPSTPIRTVSDMSSSSSVDDDLAKATNESLSMGTSIVKDMDNISFVLPPRHKLHLGLYINTAMASPETKSTTSVTTNTLNCHLASMQLGGENTINGGVPGFPDFPDCWAGGQPSTPKASNRNSTRQTNKFSNSKGKQKRCHRRIRRTAVNIPFESASSSSFSRAAVSLSPGRDMKKCARDERKLRRIAKVVQLKERRRRKKDMGDICRGMAAIKW